jgi:hypothetical protein
VRTSPYQAKLRFQLTALRALKGYFTALESDESRGVNLARGYACEYVAWRFITHLSGRELINFLLYELPTQNPRTTGDDEESGLLRNGTPVADQLNDQQPALSASSVLEQGEGISEDSSDSQRRQSAFDEENNDFVASFNNLNALEVAAVSDAKKFLAQRVVQRIIESIWKGDIVFWETLDVGSEKAVSNVRHVHSPDTNKS